MKFTVIVPTMDNLHLLTWCLLSLRHNTGFDGRVLVTDNGTGASDRLNELKLQADVIKPEGNLGFMRSCNVMLSMVETEGVLVLNDDVCFIPGSGGMWRRMDTWFGDGKVGAVGPCSNLVTGTQNLFKIRTPGDCMTVEHLCAICLFSRTSALKEVGGFNDDVVLGDDFDLCIRLRRAGWLLVADRLVYVHHFGNQTTQKVGGGRPLRDGEKAWEVQDTFDYVDMMYGKGSSDVFREQPVTPVSIEVR